MGTKFNHQKNWWEAYFSRRHPKTRQPKSLKRIGLKSQAEAKRVERELVVQLEESFKETIMLTWPKLAAQFMESKRLSDWSEKTFENCKLCLEAHTFEKWKGRRIDEITPQEIKNLLVEKVGKRSPSHQQTLLKFIRGSFQFAVDSGFLNRNPTPVMHFRIGEKIKKLLTEEQVRIFLGRAKGVDSDWYYHWAMAVYTGMRNGELYALTWDKVNLENRTILVDTSWNNKDGFKSTKSGDDRMLEIAPNLLVLLKELKLVTFDSTFVLPRSRYWDKGEQARHLRMFLQGIGLPQIRFHDLRATWATIMLSKGIEPIKVMCMGGWKDLKTMQIYIRKAGVNIKGITNNLDLHDPFHEKARVLSMTKRSES